VIQNFIKQQIGYFLMVSFKEENKIAFATCIEIVLMRTGNTTYNLIIAKLQSLYKSWIFECIDHPEYLKTVLKEVYVNNYYTVIEEIRSESDRLTDIDKLKSDFFRIMLN
jgi:isoprenylcysteine carboxyl methyltransferase (ICMT) family protein YpbQ